MSIDINEFQTKWWGSNVGIIRDADFFQQSLDVQSQQLSQFAWVEFRTKEMTSELFRQLTHANFQQWDTQLVYRLNLKSVTATSSVDGLQVRTANNCSNLEEFGWCAGNIQTFSAERFTRLPEIDDRKLNNRFIVWGERLIHNNPETCLVIRTSDKICGWMLARPMGRKLNLALGANAIDSPVSGLYVYQAATRYFAQNDWRVASASLSANNSTALNIHTQLGVRFIQPEFHFVWIR